MGGIRAIHFGLIFLDYLFGLLRDKQRPRGIVISKASRYPASGDTTLSLLGHLSQHLSQEVVKLRFI